MGVLQHNFPSEKDQWAKQHDPFHAYFTINVTECCGMVPIEMKVGFAPFKVALCSERDIYTKFMIQIMM